MCEEKHVFNRSIQSKVVFVCVVGERQSIGYSHENKDGALPQPLQIAFCGSRVHVNALPHRPLLMEQLWIQLSAALCLRS